MCGEVKVFGGMPILGLITAADMATDETDSQVQPGISDCQAVFTPLHAGRDLPDLGEMEADFPSPRFPVPHPNHGFL